MCERLALRSAVRLVMGANVLAATGIAALPMAGVGATAGLGLILITVEVGAFAASQSVALSSMAADLRA